MFKKYISDLRAEFSGYSPKKLSKDVMAGLTVAAVALPLALAFGVSSGADAASGLVTAIFAGLVIGVMSGASYQISGPTGAMSAILITISAKYGVGGVLLAGLLSGVMLLIAAILKVGRLVSFIPAPVITGFTSGIAIVIALGQVDSFFGVSSQGESILSKLFSYFSLGFKPDLWTLFFGVVVVLIMLVYPKKLAAVIPSSLAGIIAALILNLILNPGVAEVGAIPRRLMTDGALLISGIDLGKIPELLMPALSIAALGMIESLLCGASAGRMKGEKLDAGRELVAQGIGNIFIPLLGGVPATAAIARTSVAIKSGGQTRLVSVFHSLTLILSMFLLGGVMSRIPLSALAGVLMVTAWRMNEWQEIKSIFKKRFKSSIFQFCLTMAATVVFDLTVAIIIGASAAMLLFVAKSCELRAASSDLDSSRLAPLGLSGDYGRTRVVYLTGPVFFGTQEKLSEELGRHEDADCLIVSMRGVPYIDACAVTELERLYTRLCSLGVCVAFCGVQEGVMEVFSRAGFKSLVGEGRFFWDAVAAIKALPELRESSSSAKLTAACL